jgi:hypothetical protein
MRHLVIPDCQIRPGDNTDFLTCIGKFIVNKKPDRLICLGDFADMPSLSSYDKGKKAFEGKRYVKDIEATKLAMGALLAPIKEYNKNAKKTKHKLYTPSMDMLLGNHEFRTERAVNDDAKLEGVLSLDDLGYKEVGWKVHDFLDVVIIDGVAYSHYFVTGVAGRAASTAQAQFRKTNMSCIAGHQQGLQIHTGNRADGALLTSIIAGSCYEHNEDYLGPQGNKHWRGFLMLHDVHDGQFDLMPVSLDYVKKKYANTN